MIITGGGLDSCVEAQSAGSQASNGAQTGSQRPEGRPERSPSTCKGCGEKGHRLGSKVCALTKRLLLPERDARMKELASQKRAEKEALARQRRAERNREGYRQRVAATWAATQETETPAGEGETPAEEGEGGIVGGSGRARIEKRSQGSESRSPSHSSKRQRGQAASRNPVREVGGTQTQAESRTTGFDARHFHFVSHTNSQYDAGEAASIACGFISGVSLSYGLQRLDQLQQGDPAVLAEAQTACIQQGALLRT